MRAYSLYPVLTRLFPHREKMLLDRLRRALASDLEYEADLAVYALYEWTREAMRSPNQFTMPDEGLYGEVGIAIAARRTAILPTALEIARWLFDDVLAVLWNRLLQTANTDWPPSWRKLAMLAPTRHSTCRAFVQPVSDWPAR